MIDPTPFDRFRQLRDNLSAMIECRKRMDRPAAPDHLRDSARRAFMEQARQASHHLEALDRAGHLDDFQDLLKTTYRS